MEYFVQGGRGLKTAYTGLEAAKKEHVVSSVQGTQERLFPTPLFQSWARSAINHGSNTTAPRVNIVQGGIIGPIGATMDGDCFVQGDL
jgi:hypothetical protein